jgi:membrane protein DedA with SNARE-associated domain
MSMGDRLLPGAMVATRPVSIVPGPGIAGWSSSRASGAYAEAMDALTLGLLGVAALLFVKETGVPIPVPGDLVVIGAGIAASRGDLDPVPTLAVILLAGLAGGLVQFLLVRGVGRRPLLAILARVGVPIARLEAVAGRLRERGATGVAIARATPGVRIVAIAASGLAALPLTRFAAGLTVGNGLFVSGHFVLGLVVGPPALAFVAGATGPVIVALLLLGVVGGAGWWLIRRVRGGTSPAIGDWADAACPACLALGAIGRVDAASPPLLG